MKSILIYLFRILGYIHFVILKFMFYRKKESIYEVKSNKYEYFSGYYDKYPLSNDGKKLALLRFSNMNFDGKAEVLIVDLDSGNQTIIGTTKAFSMQQGAMATWLDSKLYYNVLVDDIVKTKYYDLETCNEGLLDFSFYDLNNNNLGVSLDFVGLEKYRPGYGYHAIKEVEKFSPHLIIFNILNSIKLFELSTIDVIDSLSLKQEDDEESYFNHPKFSPNGKFLVFFFIIQKKGNPKTRCIHFVKWDLENNVLQQVINNTNISHFWLLDGYLLYTALDKSNNQYHYYNYYFDSVKIEKLDYLPDKDGHPNIFKNYVITDSYPNYFGIRSLFIFDSALRKRIFKYHQYSSIKLSKRFRCDLHPKVNQRGDIVIDTSYTGRRSVVIFKNIL